MRTSCMAVLRYTLPGCLGQLQMAGARWPLFFHTTILACPYDRFYIVNSIAFAHDRSIDAMLGRSEGMALHRTEGASNGRQDERTERAEGIGRDCRRSQGAERTAGNGCERARDQRETRSRVPSLDVHATDRSEGNNLGAHARAGERDARSFHRAPVERDARGERLIVRPQGGVGRSLTGPIVRSFDRCRECQRSLSILTTPPAAPPKEELTKFSHGVRAKRVDRTFRATIGAAYAV